MTEEKIEALKDDLWVLVIGASAGGLRAIQEVLSTLPPNDKLVAFVVQHLSPRYPSHLTSILQRTTTMKVKEATNNEIIKGGTIYVAMPNHHLIIQENQIILDAESEKVKFSRPSIDVLFESASHAFGNQTIGLILSGTGSDGSNGIVTIKENGGFTIAQESSNSCYNAMPQNAINTGAIDFVLPLHEISKVISQIIEDPEAVRKELTVDEHIEIIELLRKNLKIDLFNYRRSTFKRRIRKRMGHLHITSIKDYIGYLRKNPKEMEQLHNELLINVTHFMRDEEAFASLRSNCLEPLIEQKEEEETLRVWSVGCSTGEEVYSVAFLIADIIEEKGKKLEVKIYATDVDESAVLEARRGQYDHTKTETIPKKYQEKYMLNYGSYSKVKKEIRSWVVFGVQDVTNSAPIAKVDLIICRNLLIYFEKELQKKVLKKLHYALNPDGYMFLGKSETTSILPNYFRVIDRRWRLYQTCFSMHRQAKNNCHINNSDNLATNIITNIRRNVEGNGANQNNFLATSPSELIITNINERKASLKNIFDKSDDDVGEALQREELQAANEELETAIEELQAANEELETTNEELESSNEELETLNEELEAANEELETMNEEMEVRALELQTVSSLKNSVLSSLNVAIIAVDLEGIVMEWNPAAAHLFDIPSYRALQRNFFALNIPTIFDDLKKYLELCTCGEEVPVSRTVVTWQRKKLNIDYVPLLKEYSSVLGLLIVAYDITEQYDLQEKIQIALSKEHELVEELAEAKANAEKANHLKTQFIAELSHDLRGSLNVILGMSQLGIETSPDSSMSETDYIAEQRSLFDTTYKAAENLNDLLNQVLELSSIELGKKVIENKVFSVPQLLEQVNVIIAYKAKRNKIEYLENNEVPEEYLIECDFSKLCQVLLNLLDNAVKYSKAQGKVFFTIKKQDDQLVFVVKDQGIGMSADTIQQIFKPFYRNRDVKALYGSGLGMTITQKLIQAMQGAIKIDSKIDDGTTVTVTIPVRYLQKMSEKSQRSDPISMDKLKDKIHGMKVLVADEDAVSVMLLRRLFTSLGAQVNVVANLVAAKAQIEAVRPDLIMMELQFSDGDGKELINSLSLEKERLPKMIAMTRELITAPLCDEWTVWTDDLIGKPLSLESIYSSLEKVLAE
ncbi:response regulator [Heliorestis acidaminivorans]|uniref:Stage 0 sporulation protein A homolog n=1 Tax=Heliorestis acidaminivorans TaxID=553427 RepID=A0A6I0EZ30_9FIRM|nr:chemotaxis protein CheB [Heliorestis acidaminivorans]KAB2952112.1 response regulator [Heliorestis acidaminivorans]